MTLGERLKELRLHKKLKQNYLQKKFSLSSGCYSLYENNKRKPDYELLIEFADFYGVSLDYLVGRTDDINNASRTDDLYTDKEIKLIKKYRALNEHGKKVIETVLECEYEEHAKEKLDKSWNEISA